MKSLQRRQDESFFYHLIFKRDILYIGQSPVIPQRLYTRRGSAAAKISTSAPKENQSIVFKEGK